MDPLTLGLGIAGLGLQLFGGLGQANVSKQQAQVSGNIATQEQNINVQKQMQQTLDAQRMQLQNYRNAQRQRSLATAAAVNQGASQGSGLQGGLAGITDMANFNNRSVNQNTQISNNIFGYTSAINADKTQLAQLGGQAATDQGLASLGGSLIKAGPIIGALGKNIFGGSSDSSGSPATSSSSLFGNNGIY